jgi:5-formyltetrahydrofolate cyclo-ligase
MDNLREHFKLKRKNLSIKESDDMSYAIYQRITRSKWIREYSNIGIYHPVNGEANTLQLINFMWSIGQQVFLPIIDKKNLLFGRVNVDSKLKKNRFGILEPSITKSMQMSANLLDMIFVPLVAFDLNGHRIGMGSGYYDRTFEKRLLTKDVKGPVLVGLAYEFQKQECLNRQPWDVPLDMVVTELKTYKFG